MNIGQRIREVREDLGMQRTVLARRVGAAENTIYRIETGKRTPSVELLEKIARELRIEPAELLREEPALAGKAEAPGEAGPSEAERRLSRVPEALEDWARSRALKYGDEVQDPNSPHFRTATAATLWLAQLRDERAMWANWTLKWGTDLMPPRGAVLQDDIDQGVENLTNRLTDILNIMGHLFTFDHAERKAKKRIDAMKDAPDELAARRLEEATAAAEESRERLEKWRRSASG